MLPTTCGLASIAGRPAYVLFGQAEPIVTEAMATVIDPQLPAWLRTALGEAAPRILGHYAERLGPAPDGKPTFFVSWAGPTPQTRSMGGSVLPVTLNQWEAAKGAALTKVTTTTELEGLAAGDALHAGDVLTARVTTSDGGAVAGSVRFQWSDG